MLGAITLGGTLQITTLPGFTPVQGQSFVIATGTSVSGTFADVVGAELGSGLRYVVQTTATTVVLNVAANAISVGNATATEGDNASFTVTLGPADPANTVTVAYATADGTAVDPDDYDGQSGTLTFAPGETTKTVTVPTVEDALDEADEEFTLVLSTPVGASIGDGSGAGQITDDDPAPTLSVADVSVTEGDSGVVQADFARDALGGERANRHRRCRDAGRHRHSRGRRLRDRHRDAHVPARRDDEDVQRRRQRRRRRRERRDLQRRASPIPSTRRCSTGRRRGRSSTTTAPEPTWPCSRPPPPRRWVSATQFTYTISIFNQGSGPASSVELTDDLPDGVTLVSATPTAGGSCGTVDPVVCTWASLDPFASASATIVVTAPATAATLVNTASAASPDDVNPGNNSDTVDGRGGGARRSRRHEDGLADAGHRRRAADVHGDGHERHRARGRRPAGRREAARRSTSCTCSRATAPTARSTSNGTLAGSVDSFQGWLSDKTGGQALRLDTYQGALDVTFLRLDQTDAEIAAEGAFVRDLLEDELDAAGFDDPDKLYAVYYDGTSTFACGGGAWPPTLPGNVAAMYLNGLPGSAVPCASNPFASASEPPTYQEFAMLHEIMHTLGFVPTCAPNHWRAGHVSDEPNDLMWAGDGPWAPGRLGRRRPRRGQRRLLRGRRRRLPRLLRERVPDRLGPARARLVVEAAARRTCC